MKDKRSSTGREYVFDRHSKAQMIWAMLKSYMLDECSFECAAVSNADEKNLINLIMNSLPQSDGVAQTAPEPVPAIEWLCDELSYWIETAENSMHNDDDDLARARQGREAMAFARDRLASPPAPLPAGEILRVRIARAICCPDGCMQERNPDFSGKGCYTQRDTYKFSNVGKSTEQIMAAIASPVSSTDRLTATDDGPKPVCEHCGAMVYSPCRTLAQINHCELPPDTKYSTVSSTHHQTAKD